MHTRPGAWKKHAIGYMFLAPWLLGLLGLTAVPMLSSLYLSFTDYEMFNRPQWVGWQNYTRMFSDPQFLDSVRVTVTYVTVSVPLQLLTALAVALLLNRGVRGLGVYRAVFYVPSLFGGSVAIGLLWQRLFGGDGVFNHILALFGIQGMNWVSSPQTALYTLVVLAAWQFGAPMVIFLAGLKQIPVELYEAATIDGAGVMARFFRITLPLLTPILFFNLVMQIIHAFQVFTPAYVVSNGTGGPLDATLFYSLYLYQAGFVNFRMGYASAMAWLLLAVVAVISGLLFATSRKWVYYNE
ncbi:sugar ABC transporter permease [Alicyclobacillus cellulosilyticus]|uniref:Sugar ABC transporter permease n=1 Tax=Alicyclobacillus cellulosilyticus TaxID=1003997 RepID=A0A917NM65_9BACL|nr:sugar ABC transporter permease [Alicyclobacillus cellulosilyticus]GGJ08334.1 sugar ABC transporter permease [Alicyclobacillus cellulosilyticus]